MSRDRRRFLQRIVKGKQRVWEVNSDAERKAVTGFLRLCSSTFTINEMDELRQEDMQRVVSEILDGKTSMDKLGELDASELYDHIVGQGRLF